MSKPPSLKQLALAITGKVIQRFEDEDSAASKDKVYHRDFARQRLHHWMESVSNITIDELERVKAAGELVIVPYDGRQYLPDDLRIVKEYRNSAAAGPLVDAHDRQRTNVPFEKLFDPSLFPELDYAEIRSRSLILGENKRVPVGEATPEHYRIHDQIEKANNEAQVKAYGEYVKAINRRKRLFARHPDCKTTDQLMRKLGLWK